MAKKVGLALSGGGARGFAHIGVAKVLAEAGIKVELIAGTSAGAIVGGALASGMSPAEVETMAMRVRWPDLVRPSMSPLAILSNRPMGRFLRANLPVDTFERLAFPFASVTCDLISGTEEVLENSGDLIEAILASCAVPGIFVPVAASDGRLLVDGGVVRPLPVETVRRMGADVVIAVDLMASGATFRSRPRTALGMTLQSTMHLLRAASRSQHRLADVVIVPPIGHLRPDEIGARREFIELGEKAARDALAEIEKLS